MSSATVVVRHYHWVGGLLLGCLAWSTACGSGSEGEAMPGSRELQPIAAPPVPDDCITDVGAGDHRFTCEALDFRCEPDDQGVDTGCFHVTVPEQCVDYACGVILNVHGLQMNGPQQAELTHMIELGREHSYIVVHPTAHLGLNPLPGPSETPSWRASDDAKVVDFLQRVIVAWHADRDRIHVTGFSQGGAMTWRMLCEHADLFASAAPGAAASASVGGGASAAGTGGICNGGTSMPEPSRPILFLHGRDDGLSPYSVARQTAGTIIEAWGLQEEILSEDEHHRWARHASEAGELFEFIEYDYASTIALLRGHCFPGTGIRSTLSCERPRDVTPAFAWGETVMNFFLAHPKS